MYHYILQTECRTTLEIYILKSVKHQITVTNRNGIDNVFKRRINMGYACYYSLEKIL